jgi:hypothetical protein
VAAQGNGILGVLLRNGDGTFGQAAVQLATFTYPFGDAQFASGIAAGDFNGDYTFDLVLGGGLAGFADTTVTALFNMAGFYLYVNYTITITGTSGALQHTIQVGATVEYGGPSQSRPRATVARVKTNWDPAQNSGEL